VGGRVFEGAGELVNAGVKVDITTLFAPSVNISLVWVTNVFPIPVIVEGAVKVDSTMLSRVGVTRGELVAIERIKPIPQQNKITMPTMDKIEACFFAGGFVFVALACWVLTDRAHNNGIQSHRLEFPPHNMGIFSW